ncbi:MAG TPA: TIGR03067 domain-containing protein [Puia sp.]|nr:TIGR03067 domain-containing protein [Puia sp.]
MRLLIALIFLANTAFFVAKRNYVNTNLNGTWIPVKQELNGAPLPEASFEKQRLIINDTSYTFVAESTDKGTAKFIDGKLDIYSKEGVNTGKHFTAIYKFENELLTICYNLAGNSYPETFDTKGKPLFFLSVFKKDSSK